MNGQTVFLVSVLARCALDVPLVHRGAAEVETAVGALGHAGVHALRADRVGQVGRDELGPDSIEKMSASVLA